MMTTPDSSTHTFRSNEEMGGAHGDCAMRETLDELGLSPEWSVKRVAGILIPYLSGKSKPTPEVTCATTVDNIKINTTIDRIPPFECGVCFGPVIQATMPKCGHIFCMECINECKKRINACPICRESLSLIIPRIYAVDELTEEYLKTTPYPALCFRNSEMKRKRIEILIQEMEHENSSLKGKVGKLCDRFCFFMKSKGIIGGTHRCLYRLTRRRFPKYIVILTGGILIGVILDRLFQAGSSGNCYFLTYWWNHFINGVKNYPSEPFRNETVVQAESDGSILGWISRKIFGGPYSGPK